jgi:hypothetical protein
MAIDEKLDVDVRNALHEIFPAKVKSRPTNYSMESLKGAYPLSEVYKMFDEGKEIRTHCHGKTALAMKYLGSGGIVSPENMRARFVLKNYNYHMLMEYRNGQDWVMLDPGREKDDFTISSDTLKSYEAMRNGDHEKLKRGRSNPETTALNVMSQDIIAATQGAFQPWEYDFNYSIGDQRIRDENAKEMYQRIGLELERVLEKGNLGEMNAFKGVHGIRLG